MLKIAPFSGLLLLALGLPAFGQEAAPAAPARTPAPPNAMVYFLSPANGATVSSPVTIRFGLRGCAVRERQRGVGIATGGAYDRIDRRSTA